MSIPDFALHVQWFMPPNQAHLTNFTTCSVESVLSTILMQQLQQTISYKKMQYKRAVTASEMDLKRGNFKLVTFTRPIPTLFPPCSHLITVFFPPYNAIVAAGGTQK